MYLNAKASELLPVVGKITPATVNSTIAYSDVVDVSKYHGVYAVALFGDMANETIDFKAYSCDDSSGTNPVAMSGYAMTQLAASASANDSKGASISMQSDALIASGKQYIKFGIVTGNTTGGPCAMVVLGVGPRLGPVSPIAAMVQTV